MNARRGPAILMALAATSFYGGVPPVTRLAIDSGASPLDATFVRTVVMIVVLSIAAVAMRQSFTLPRRLWPAFAGQVAATLVISVGYLASVAFIPVSLAVVLFYTFPIIILSVAPVIDREPFGAGRLAIVLLGFTGLVLAVGLDVGTLDWRGIALAIASAIFYAVQFFTGRRLVGEVSPTVFGSLVHMAIWPATLGLSLWTGGGTIGVFPGGPAQPMALTWILAGSAGYLGGYILQMLALRNASPAVVAPVFNWEPIVSIALAIVVLGERLTMIQYAGVALVIGALVLASMSGRRNLAPA